MLGSSSVTQARAEPPPAFQDTAGSERYEAMSRIYYRGAKAAIVCYGKRGSGLFLKQEGVGVRLALENCP